MGSSSVELISDRRAGTLGPVGTLSPGARAYAEQARSESTRKAYAFHLRGFAGWCASEFCEALPATGRTVAEYLKTKADQGVSVSGMALALSAISQAHVDAGLPSPRLFPEVQLVWKGIRNSRRDDPKRQAKAISTAELRAMVRTGDTLLDLRDRALLLLGFVGAFRRSELVGLDVADLEFCDDGVVVSLRHSKTDQTGAGRQIPVPFGSARLTCAVRALRDWLTAASIVEGAVFRGVKYGRTHRRLCPGDVAVIAKRRALDAGIAVELVSGHSLRAGLATSAAKAGKSLASIQATTGHKSIQMVSHYVRRGTLFEDCAASGIGL